MIWRTLTIAICFIGLPQVGEAQESIAEIYEHIRKDAEKYAKENAERIERKNKYLAERRKREKEYWENYYNSDEYKRRIERVKKIEENKKLITQLRNELAAALAEDQREAVRYKY